MKICKKLKIYRMTNCSKTEEFAYVSNVSRMTMGEDPLSYAALKYNYNYFCKGDYAKYQTRELIDFAHEYLNIPRGKRRFYPKSRRIYLLSVELLERRKENNVTTPLNFNTNA